MNAKNQINRRQFLSNAAAAAATVTIVAPHVLGGAKTPPSDKLNIAGIGIGGKGFGDIRSVPSENIVALCDVDSRQIARSANQFPKER